jgi:hypothetical protein
MVWMPNPTAVPAAGDWVMVSEAAAVQLSEAATAAVRSGMVARQFASAAVDESAGQLTLGDSVSLTVTWMAQSRVLPYESMAVQVTMVVPTAKVLPDGGEQVTKAEPQLSLATGVGNVTTALHCPGSLG